MTNNLCQKYFNKDCDDLEYDDLEIFKSKTQNFDVNFDLSIIDDEYKIIEKIFFDYFYKLTDDDVYFVYKFVKPFSDLKSKFSKKISLQNNYKEVINKVFNVIYDKDYLEKKNQLFFADDSRYLPIKFFNSNFFKLLNTNGVADFITYENFPPNRILRLLTNSIRYDELAEYSKVIINDIILRDKIFEKLKDKHNYGEFIFYLLKNKNINKIKDYIQEKLNINKPIFSYEDHKIYILDSDFELFEVKDNIEKLMEFFGDKIKNENIETYKVLNSLLITTYLENNQLSKIDEKDENINDSILASYTEYKKLKLDSLTLLFKIISDKKYKNKVSEFLNTKLLDELLI